MEKFNPIVIFLYFLGTAGISMLCMNPVMQAIGFIGALAYFLVRNLGKRTGSHWPFFLLAAFAFFLNPLLTHNGATVLFFLNGNPVTLEACLYGAVCGIMLLGMLYWFRSFSALMPSDKILYLLGRISPKLALMLSMALRYVPLFGMQMKKTAAAQRAMGMIREDDAIARIRGGVRVFSVTLTWALENGIVTADGMEARGYSDGRRTSFAIYRFYRRDGVLLALIGVLVSAIVVGLVFGCADHQYYPIFTVRMDTTAILIYCAYGLLVCLPSAIEAGDIIKWKYLQSKI